MKPDHAPATPRLLSHYDALSRSRVSVPQMTAEYQPRHDGPPGGGGAFDGNPRRPGFTRLAREVLGADANRTFRLETTVLGVVTLVSAWPVATMIHEVIRLLK